jgi:hypothetical protein
VYRTQRKFCCNVGRSVNPKTVLAQLGTRPKQKRPSHFRPGRHANACSCANNKLKHDGDST